MGVLLLTWCFAANDSQYTVVKPRNQNLDEQSGVCCGQREGANSLEYHANDNLFTLYKRE